MLAQQNVKEKLTRARSLAELISDGCTAQQDLQQGRGEKFLANAPADVVDKERAKLAELEARLAKNEESRGKQAALSSQYS